MRYLEKYTGNKTYMAPSGAIMTPEVTVKQFPAVTVFAHVVETDANGEIMFALQNLSAMRSQYGIAPELSEAEAIAALQEAINVEPEHEPTAEERIAAMLEYQNLLGMEDA